MNKIFHIGSSSFKAFEEDGDLHITGMASTSAKDRVGDIIEPEAWEKGGIRDYLNNPVILFNHDYNQPIGKAVVVQTSNNGLQLKAKIAKSAGHVGELIKEGVLGAFSVGFRVKDAEYMKETDGYRIKDAELLEVSVVSVPANQTATFSLAKSFDSTEEYEEFKQSFTTAEADSEKHVHSVSQNDDTTTIVLGNHKEEADQSMPKDLSQVEAQEKEMSDVDIDAIVQSAVEKATTAMAMKEAERKAEEATRLEEEQKAVAEADEQKRAEEERISVAVTTGAEKLMGDLEEKFQQKDADHEKVVQELQTEISEKSEEIMKIRESKRVFADRGNNKGIGEGFESEIADASLLGVITRKGWDTDYAKGLMEKATPNDNASVIVPAAETVTVFESIASTQVEQDIELDLVLKPLFREIQMTAAAMRIPTFPDAGYAEFAGGGSSFTTAAGSGSGSAHKGNLESRSDTVGSPYAGMQMTSKVLTVDKLVSTTYLANEVEEDAILPILPLLRDAMSRSHARAIENAILLGSVGDASPSSMATSSTDATFSGLVRIAADDAKATESHAYTAATETSYVLDMRQAMGKYGRRPSDTIYIVSIEAYYSMLDDSDFQSINEVGNDRAVKITGEIGNLYGSPVIVCDEFPTAAAGKVWGVAVNPRNFVIPRLRGVTIEQDYDVENQRRVLVATQRLGFDQLFSTAGQVVVKKYNA